ncbi:MAG: hypothetical protein GYA33_05885 [Thermogutta sp.]|nr:hypothetical protein [Thermogutta sp.]
MKMPFGRYRGATLSSVPESYLCWLLDNADLSPTLERAVSERLGIEDLKRERRQLEAECQALAYERARLAAGKANVRPKIDDDLINKWYRDLAKRFHPDHGGSHEAMKGVNAARDLLLKIVHEG